MDTNENQSDAQTLELEKAVESVNVDDVPVAEEAADFKLDLDYYDQAKQEEKLWQFRTGLNNETLCAAIETIIFMSDRPVAITKIKKMIDEEMPLRAIHDAISKLQEEYEHGHHGIRLVEVGEGYQFRTKATYSKYVQDLFKVNSLLLTPSALEVLAIIAYKQPVAKTEIDKIRGVDSAHIVRALMDKRLVKVVGRSEDVGRPTIFGTTPEFLEVFNLANLEALPPEYELQEIASASDIGQISDIKNICDGDKERFKFDDLEELDQITESIKHITSDTEFTKSLNVEEKRRIEADGSPGKTAFEILEEYLELKLIKTQNQKALESSDLGVFGDPLVISDLTAGPYNLPRPEEEMDDFQMIDLDTGETIAEDEIDYCADEEEDQPQALFDDSEDEAMALGKALDQAFEKLTGEKLSFDEQPSDLEDNAFWQDDKVEKLDEFTHSMIEKGKDLGLDLTFLGDNSSKSGDGPQDDDFDT